MHFDAELAEPSRVQGLVAVVADDDGPDLHERLGGRLPGAGETDHEDACALELGASAHRPTNWRNSL